MVAKKPFFPFATAQMVIVSECFCSCCGTAAAACRDHVQMAYHHRIHICFAIIKSQTSKAAATQATVTLTAKVHKHRMSCNKAFSWVVKGAER